MGKAARQANRAKRAAQAKEGNMRLSAMPHEAMMPRKIDQSPGLWEITQCVLSEGPFNSMFIKMGDTGPSAADTLARNAIYDAPSDRFLRLISAAGKGNVVTTLHVSSAISPFGNTRVFLHQGRLDIDSQRRLTPSLVTLGEDTRTYPIVDMVDFVVEGGEKGLVELSQRWFDRTILPPTRRISADGLKHEVAAGPVALLYTHRGFGGGPVPGCIWLIEAVEGDVAWGYLWCPDSELTSEYGSVAVQELLDTAALATKRPALTSSSAWGELPSETRNAYGELFPTPSDVALAFA